MDAAKSKRKTDAPKTPNARLPEWVTWAGYLTFTLMGAVAFALVFPFTSLLPMISVPAVVGAAIGLWCRQPLVSGALGALSGLMGSLLVVRPYVVDNFVAWTRTGLPSYAMQDTASQMLQFIVDLQRAHPINTMSASSAGVVLVCTLAVAAVALTVSWLGSVVESSSMTRWLPWMVVALLCSTFAYTAWTGGASFRQSVSIEPQNGQYAYDPVFNVRTYYLMRQGQSFYDAYVYSVGHDARHIEAKTLVGDKLTWPGTAFRPPLAFYVWKWAGRSGSDGVVAFSVLCCIAILCGLFSATKPILGTRALVLPMLLYPGLMLHTVWLNVFFPDWWAALAMLASVVLVLSKRYHAAAIFAGLAMVFRETFGAWMLIMLLGAVWMALRVDRSWLRRVYAHALAMALGIAAFSLHVITARRHAVNSGTAGSTVAALLTQNSGRGLDWKYLAPTSYLMLPYGMYHLPTWLMLPAAAAGFWLGLPRSSFERLVLTAFPLAMGAFYLTVGATSSYWGQGVMPLAVVGAGLLLARADLIAYQIVARIGGDPVAPFELATS